MGWRIGQVLARPAPSFSKSKPSSDMLCGKRWLHMVWYLWLTICICMCVRTVSSRLPGLDLSVHKEMITGYYWIVGWPCRQESRFIQLILSLLGKSRLDFRESSIQLLKATKSSYFSCKLLQLKCNFYIFLCFFVLGNQFSSCQGFSSHIGSWTHEGAQIVLGCSYW